MATSESLASGCQADSVKRALRHAGNRPRWVFLGVESGCFDIL